MTNKLTVAFLLLAAIVATASASHCPTDIVTANVDVQRYLGIWFEIATTLEMRETWERNCYCTYANYTPDSQGIRVTNACRKGSVSAPIQFAYGQATVPNPNATGQLAVKFNPNAPAAPYWIIILDPDYQYAVVWSCSNILGVESYSMWVLNRQPTMDPATYAMLVAKASAITGIDAATALIPTVQAGCPPVAV